VKSSAKKASRPRAAPTPEKKLAEYRAKRDFEGTSEPAGGEHGTAGARFVVQEHSATRLHWDLRLEREGVAVSWAIPNGIPQEQGELRKAVHTEDHPLEYLTWEGDIPKGNYGAGTMKVWDAGTYDCHEWTGNKVTATFHGKRVTGRYHLFQAGRDEKEWMIRRVDPPADPDREPMPEHVEPVVPVPGKLPKDDARYAYEIAWGGVRAIAFCEPGRLRLENADGEDVTELFPDVGRLTRQVGAHTAVLDGELLVLDENGKPDPDRLARRLRPAKESTVRTRARETPAVYEIYDVLYLDGRSLTELAWRERRAKLEELELNGPHWRVSHPHAGDGAALLEAARAAGLSGIVAKPLDSRYGPDAGWVAVRSGY
jgi:bifunctional non-homologous end joining protein LigD